MMVRAGEEGLPFASCLSSRGVIALVSTLASLKVCIADTDATMRRMIREALNSLGIAQVRECADTEAAQQVIAEFEPDLCLLDAEIGPLDAVAFVRRVRAAESLRADRLFDDPYASAFVAAYPRDAEPDGGVRAGRCGRPRTAARGPVVGVC